MAVDQLEGSVGQLTREHGVRDADFRENASQRVPLFRRVRAPISWRRFQFRRRHPAERNDAVADLHGTLTDTGLRWRWKGTVEEGRQMSIACRDDSALTNRRIARLFELAQWPW